MGMSSLLLITPPASEPITLAEAKAHCRVAESADDALLTSLMTAARLVAEVTLGRALITQTMRYLADAAPEGEALELPRPPLQSIAHIKSYDDADLASVFSSSNYLIDTSSHPGRIVLRAGACWPGISRAANGFEVQYVAGYGDAAAVPAPIKAGMLAHIAQLYTHRGDALLREGQPDASSIALPQAAQALYAPYRLLRGVS
jgi:uncharacterized phiE125 gp8 family phage protein